jgi:hypothetical protein
MKDGFRIYDADTHVNPAAEVLRYVDPGFRRPILAQQPAQCCQPAPRDAQLHY